MPIKRVEMIAKIGKHIRIKSQHIKLNKLSKYQKYEIKNQSHLTDKKD